MTILLALPYRWISIANSTPTVNLTLLLLLLVVSSLQPVYSTLVVAGEKQEKGLGEVLHVGKCPHCTHATIHSARDEIRRMRSLATNTLSSSPPSTTISSVAQTSAQISAAAAAAAAAAANPESSISPLFPGGWTVIVHSGRYDPMVLDPILDSGLSAEQPVRYMSAAAAAAAAAVVESDDGVRVSKLNDTTASLSQPVIVSAGVPIPASAWQPAGPSHAPGVFVANLSAIGLGPDNIGMLPDVGATIDGCDQAKAKVMQLYHRETIGNFGPHLARYPNRDQSTGNWRFLHALGSSSSNGTASSSGDMGGGSGGGQQHGGITVAEADRPRVLAWAKREAAPYVQGYWEYDWSDQVMRVGNATDTALLWAAATTTAGPVPKKNARYLGLNLLSELDAPGEYYIDAVEARVYYLPIGGAASLAAEAPVVTLNTTALTLDGTSHVHVSGMTYAHARVTGISARNTTGVLIQGCTIFGVGAQGIDAQGSGNIVDSSRVFNVGCRGISMHCGDAYTLSPGNCTVSSNNVTQMALLKRTYQPGIHWGGVGNHFTGNRIWNGPHNCILGGGNEATEGAVNNVFEYNDIDYCSYESSDTGAFYTCGQQATAFAGPGNIVRHNTFTRIRNTEGSGVQSITVQALYLDDQMSSWSVYNNTFRNCSRGVLLGGGRLNTFKDNAFVDIDDVGIAFDNRGMGWQKQWDCAPKDGSKCVPLGGSCTCNVAGLQYELNGPAGQQWRARYPALAKSLTDVNCQNSKDGNIPCYNTITNNTICRVKNFITASPEQVASWHSVVTDNLNKC